MKKSRELLLLFLLLLGGITILYAQNVQLKGKVVNAAGSPIEGASVIVKGSTRGTHTGKNGTFNVSVAPGSTLLITYLGYAPFEHSVIGASDNLVITLVDSQQNLDEVIVSGVAGATSKNKLTVSVTKIGEEALKAAAPISVATSLSGKVAGFRSSQSSGRPGTATSLQLRGDNNLNNVGSGPLIIIDGAILGSGSETLSDINADDVESIEAVKGASASALYGSRAGNGVLVVTTKRGRSIAMNTSKITIRNEAGIEHLPKKYKLSTHHFYNLADDWENYQGQYTKYAGVTYPDGYTGGGFSSQIQGSPQIKDDGYQDQPYGVYHDIQDQIYGTGLSLTNYVAATTRYQKGGVFASFENNKQNGIIKDIDGYSRQNFRLNIDQELAPWLKVSASNLFISTTSNNISTTNAFYNALRITPDVNLYQQNADGQPYYIRVMQNNSEVTNPLYSLHRQQYVTKGTRWLGTYNANFQFTRWANLDVTHSIEIANSKYKAYTPKDYLTNSSTDVTPVYNNGSLSYTNDYANNQNTQATLNLHNKFGELNVNGKLSFLYENRRTEQTYAGGSVLGYKDIPDLDNTTSGQSVSSSTTAEKAYNYFAIVGLDYKDRYLLDGLFRYDGSSLFGSEERWNPYYRISGAYRISKDVRIDGIDELKIRGAYGTSGQRPGFDWQYYVYSLSNGQATPSQAGNPYLKPSKTAETEIGLNVRFLKKYSFEAVYARAKTTDQFLNEPVLPILNDGFSRKYLNDGTVKSNTLELTFAADWIKNRDFSWNSNIVFSRTRTKITALGAAPYTFGAGNNGGSFYIRAGETYGAIYGNDAVRTLDQMSQQLPSGTTIADYEVNSDGFVVAKGSQGTLSELAIPLQNADGSTWFGKIGDGNPKFNLGIANTFNYKGISLYFLIDIKAGGDIYDGRDQWLLFNNAASVLDQSGKPQNEKKAYTYYNSFYNANSTHKYWIQSGGYGKLREVALGYTFSQKSLGKLGNTVKAITAKAIGRNLLTVTDYTGFDPEVGSLREPFDGTTTYPNFRNYAFSLSFDF